MKHLGMGLVALAISACTVQTSGLLGNRSTSPTTIASSGSSRAIVMPDLTLMTEAEAEAALRHAGFAQPPSIDTAACGSTLDDHRTIVERGRVCYQQPAPGRETRATLPVSIRVQHEDPRRGELSGGRFWFLMPDLAGMELEAAKQRIRALGFTSREVRVAYADNCKPNVVCKTFPEAMVRTDNTSDKTLFVGHPPIEPKPVDPKDPSATQPTPSTKPSLGDNF